MDYLFSKPAFNCVGDPYVDPGSNPFEHGTLLKGRRQFQIAPPKRSETVSEVDHLLHIIDGLDWFVRARQHTGKGRVPG